jgi:hypothetical protein
VRWGCPWLGLWRRSCALRWRCRCTLQMRIFQTLLRLRLWWLRRRLGMPNLLDMDTLLGMGQHLLGRIHACG